MKLEWMADSIGDRKSWVLRDVDDGGRPRATVIQADIAAKFYLVVVGSGEVGRYETVEEPMEVGSMLATKSKAEIAAYKIAIRRLT